MLHEYKNGGCFQLKPQLIQYLLFTRAETTNLPLLIVRDCFINFDICVYLLILRETKSKSEKAIVINLNFFLH